MTSSLASWQLYVADSITYTKFYKNQINVYNYTCTLPYSRKVWQGNVWQIWQIIHNSPNYNNQNQYLQLIISWLIYYFMKLSFTEYSKRVNSPHFTLPNFPIIQYNIIDSCAVAIIWNQLLTNITYSATYTKHCKELDYYL